ncbi:MAG TPA: cell division protein FtsZ [Thermoplasmata archaeon]|nr:cell division protein FtsZ [Thermoplasmata archaeon]
MRPLAQEILAHLPGSETKRPATSPPAAPSGDDAELEAVLASLKTHIKVVGCGGGGCNTINRLSEEGLSDTEMVACNTDAQHLLAINAPKKILLGRRLTRGLGAGALPQIGEQAAMEAEDEIKKALADSDMVFITLGLGGGTGTGSAPVVAKLAKDANGGNPLTIAVCTLPFASEGMVRAENAMSGLERLRSTIDTVITIPNDRLLELVPRLPIQTAFKVADSVLARAIRGITEIITRPGLVNLDFNDLRTIMKGGGVALIGIGESESDNRAEDAVLEAIHSPLLKVDIAGATGALINVTGGPDMTVSEAQKAAEVVQKVVSPNARIIWGAAVDPTMQSTIRVMLVVTGVKSPQIFAGPSAGGAPARKAGPELDVVR